MHQLHKEIAFFFRGNLRNIVINTPVRDKKPVLIRGTGNAVGRQPP